MNLLHPSRKNERSDSKDDRDSMCSGSLVDAAAPMLIYSPISFESTNDNDDEELSKSAPIQESMPLNIDNQYRGRSGTVSTPKATLLNIPLVSPICLKSRDLSPDPFAANDFVTACNHLRTITGVVNGAYVTLGRLLKQIGTHRDNMEHRDKIHSTSSTTNSKILQTKLLFGKVGALSLLAKDTDKEYWEQLKSDFKTSVQRYHEQQEIIVARIRNVPPLPSERAAMENLLRWNDSDDEDEDVEVKERVKNIQGLRGESTFLNEHTNRCLQLEADIVDINEVFQEGPVTPPIISQKVLPPVFNNIQSNNINDTTVSKEIKPPSTTVIVDADESTPLLISRDNANDQIVVNQTIRWKFKVILISVVSTLLLLTTIGLILGFLVFS